MLTDKTQDKQHKIKQWNPEILKDKTGLFFNCDL